MIKRPNSRVNLDKAIERIFGNYEKSLETRSIMANAKGEVGRSLEEAIAWVNKFIATIGVARQFYAENRQKRLTPRICYSIL